MDAHPRRSNEEINISGSIHFIIFSNSSSDEEFNRNISIELYYQETKPIPHGLSQEEIHRLQEIIYNGEYCLEESTPGTLILKKKSHDCAICLSSIQKGDCLRKLNCGHFFHKNCLDGWLKLKGACPLDRKKI
ncbi:hypothetical protein SteCoe_39418 [Stentor coeruleus]|uniref:RING-type domain-containing protein n=1 Tax=Stentor coeruleus TaxID=5963 RepID=A0A1R2AKR6_9CILI|nr:hypothetical protein SteCoe_39418 [Stentor coeruleus]